MISVSLVEAVSAVYALAWIAVLAVAVCADWRRGREADSHERRCRSEKVWLGSVLDGCSCGQCKRKRLLLAEKPEYREIYARLKGWKDAQDDPNRGAVSLRA